MWEFPFWSEIVDNIYEKVIPEMYLKEGFEPQKVKALANFEIVR